MSSWTSSCASGFQNSLTLCYNCPMWAKALAAVRRRTGAALGHWSVDHSEPRSAVAATVLERPFAQLPVVATKLPFRSNFRLRAPVLAAIPRSKLVTPILHCDDSCHRRQAVAPTSTAAVGRPCLAWLPRRGSWIEPLYFLQNRREAALSKLGCPRPIGNAPSLSLLPPLPFGLWGRARERCGYFKETAG